MRPTVDVLVNISLHIGFGISTCLMKSKIINKRVLFSYSLLRKVLFVFGS